jgi:hypothetical protein
MAKVTELLIPQSNCHQSSFLHWVPPKLEAMGVSQFMSHDSISRCKILECDIYRTQRYLPSVKLLSSNKYKRGSFVFSFGVYILVCPSLQEP